tara:strand:- start:426 stop:578 length:153 start_codon:yes stop_codon:yes gene_type:complete
MKNDFEELEWYSVCCTAPPLYDLHDNGEYEPLGICMHCRDNTTFELLKEK